MSTQITKTSSRALGTFCGMISFRFVLGYAQIAIVLIAGSRAVADTAPVFSAVPAAQTTTAGGAASFSVAATGNPAPVFSWEVSADGGASWSSISNGAPYSGATSSVLSLSGAGIEMDALRYRCLATNSVASVASASAKLSVEGPLVWTPRNSGTVASLFGVTWGGSVFMAVGQGGTILISPQGATWSPRPPGIGTDLYSVAWGRNLYVVVGSGGTILTNSLWSTPEPWVPRSAGTTADLRSVIWNGNQFVAVGAAGVILTSSDGLAWTMQNSGVSNNLRGVAWSGSEFVVGAQSTFGTPQKILRSPDGISWMAQTLGATSWLDAIAWGGSQFAMVGNNGSILTSPDGATWTARYSGVSDWLSGVAWGGSQFVAVGYPGLVFTSADGHRWIRRNSGASTWLNGVAWNGDQYVAVGAFGTVITSGTGSGVAINPASRSLGSAGGTYAISVSAAESWTPVVSVPWIGVAPPSGTGNGSVVVTVGVNPAASERSGTIAIGGRLHTITQAGTAPVSPLFTGAYSAFFTLGQAGTHQLTASGSPLPIFSAPIGLPPWATLDPLTGMISGTPLDTQGYSLFLVAENGVGTPAVRSFVITVQAPPAILSQSPSQVSATLGQSMSLGVNVANAFSAEITYQWRKDGVVVPGATSLTYPIGSVQTADAGVYTVTVWNPVGYVVSNPMTLSVLPAPVASATHSASGVVSATGATVTVANTLTYTGTFSQLSWHVLLPSGWTFVSGTSTGTSQSPTAGAASVLDWTWASVPPSPVTFSYTLDATANPSGAATLAALATLQAGSTPSQFLATPDPYPVGRRLAHTIDTNYDFQISLFELTRVIELYNTRNGTTRTGAYAVATGITEDGFSPDPARAVAAVVTLSRHHSADTSPRDGKLSLIELTRAIELYNYRNGTTRTGQYRVQVGTEDGFAPGP